MPDSHIRAAFADLERKHDARLGVWAHASASGASIEYRADTRFAMCSTFKAFLAADILRRRPLTDLDTRVSISGTDIRSISPVTEHHVGSSLTIRQLCAAAVRYSDGTAANLLLKDIGGPPALTRYFRSLGDRVSRLDQSEPALNRNPPGDPRNTTSPRAIGSDLARIVLSDALPATQRSMLTGWLEHTTTGGGRIRAGVPHGTTVADKSGTGDYGRSNDIAILWPKRTAPLTLAIMSDRHGYGAAPSYALIADATTHICSMLI